MEDVESGKLCYRLNEGKTLNPIWYQTLGQDAHPIFDASHLVVLKSDDDTYYNVTNLAGDVNSDGVLDKTDLQWLTSHLLGQTPEGFEIVNADANLDSHVNVADIVMIRRILADVPLGEDGLTARLYSSNASVKAGGTRKMTVWISLSRPSTAFEADIALSDGLSIKEGSIAFGTKIDKAPHQAHVFPKSDGAHILVFAPENDNLAITTGTALTFTLEGGNDFDGGTYEIRNQCFATADGVVCSPDNECYDVSLAKTYITSILLEPAVVDMVAGTDTLLAATIIPATATIKTLDWLTSDASVASVANGIVTAVSTGSATITAKATDGSAGQATATINVYPDADGIAVPLADLKDATIFTLSGTRLDRITRAGIYIINGKKRFVKVK